jgi:hypothetical protein
LRSIWRWAKSMTLPMAFRPNAWRGVVRKAAAKAAALSGPSITSQGTTTAYEFSAPHSTKVTAILPRYPTPIACRISAEVIAAA